VIKVVHGECTKPYLVISFYAPHKTKNGMQLNTKSNATV